MAPRNESQPLFSVLTCTHNRADYLPRLYASLCRQQQDIFEWLVIDDGSEDQTADLIVQLQQQSPFAIRYIHQEKAGKHVAFNRGVRAARGEYILDVDSDDSLLPNAMAVLHDAWEALTKEQRSKLVGVMGLCINDNHEVVGDYYPTSCFISDLITLRFVHRVKGDKHGFNRRDVLKKFPLPEPDDKALDVIPERIMWFRIARHYGVLCINEPIYIYHSDPYANQLTGRDFPKRADSAFLAAQATLNEHMDWFRYRPRHFTHAAVKFARAAFHLNYSLVEQYRALDRWAVLLWLFALPKAFIYFRRDQRRATPDA